jgi:hypothetical protein
MSVLLPSWRDRHGRVRTGDGTGREFSTSVRKNAAQPVD